METRVSDCICHCSNKHSDRCLAAEIRCALEGLKRAMAAADAQGLDVYLYDTNPDLTYHNTYLYGKALNRYDLRAKRTISYDE